MFVQENTLAAIRSYMSDRLGSKFSQSEIKQIVKSSSVKRLKISENDYILADEIKLSESDLLYFRSIVKRLLNDEPLQYILGSTLFYGLELLTDQRALIPRPETEELVDWVVKDHESRKNLEIADFCSGTGCIALALADQLSNAHVSAVEWSDDAFELINENAAFTGIDIEIIKADVLDDTVRDHFKPGSLDVLVSNPPYIPVSEMDQMDANVLDHEPQMALFVEDANPLVFYLWITEHAKVLLKQGGSLYFEINEGHGDQVVHLLRSKGLVNIELRKDLEGRDRMVKAML